MRNTKKSLSNTSVWLTIDPDKVKWRIDRITDQLMKVIQKVEAETNVSDHPEKS